MSSIDHALYNGAYLIHGEDPEEFAVLCEEYRRRFAPDSVDTECLVASLIHTEWRMRRYRKVETQQIELSVRQSKRTNPPPELSNRAFHLVRKQLDALGRSYQADLRLLMKLREGSARKLGTFPRSAREAAKSYISTPPPPKTRPN